MEQKINTGVLFKNDQRNDTKKPAYRGNLLISDGKFSLAGWESKPLDPFAENKGVLFPYETKNEEKQPDYIGCINVNGRMLFISAWERTSAKGLHYYSISFREWRDQFKTTPQQTTLSLACQQWIEKG